MVILSFDVGRKKTGIAIGNTLSGLARPLDVVYGSRNQQLAAIDSYIATWKPQRLLIGLPCHMDGKEHQMSRYCRDFSQLLAARFDLPISLIDERLTTQTARSIIGSAIEQPIDSTAAAVILQDFLRQSARENNTASTLTNDTAAKDVS